MQKYYAEKRAGFVANALLILGGLNMLAMSIGYNPIQMLAKHTFKAFDIALYLLIGIAAMYNMFDRNYYLPFLGDSVAPCSIMTEKFPIDYSVSVKINIPKKQTTIIYWAAEPNTKIIDNPWDAYGKYMNSGVTTSDDDGNAILRVRKPAIYKIPRGKVLKTHIHYRFCEYPGILSKVYTTYV